MTSLLRVVLGGFVLLLVTACGGGAAGTSATRSSSAVPSTAAMSGEDAVRVAFKTYKDAALAKDGATAAAVLASPVFGFYDDARELALTGTEEELRDLPPSKVLTVYLLRAEGGGAEALRGASPEEVMKDAIDKGLVGEDGVNRVELGAIEVEGDRAAAEVLSGGNPTSFKMPFLREDGRWKLNLEPVITLADDAFRGTAEQQGVSIDQLLTDLLRQKYGAEKLDGLRKPLEG